MSSRKSPGPACSTRAPEPIDLGTLSRTQSPVPGPVGTGFQPQLWPLFGHSALDLDAPRCEVDDGPTGTSTGAPAGDSAPQQSAATRVSASTLSLSDDGANLLKQVETLRLQPYDDQTQDDIDSWVKGATIGYGHLIKFKEWDLYKDGISLTDAAALFNADAKPMVDAVRTHVTAALTQNEFDALVILTFNIGVPNFCASSVLQLVNDPKARTSFDSLEAAWKSWRKSQGKVMKGLENRRACEWKIYTQGVYERW